MGRGRGRGSAGVMLMVLAVGDENRREGATVGRGAHFIHVVDRRALRNEATYVLLQPFLCRVAEGLTQILLERI